MKRNIISTFLAILGTLIFLAYCQAGEGKEDILRKIEGTWKVEIPLFEGRSLMNYKVEFRLLEKCLVVICNPDGLQSTKTEIPFDNIVHNAEGVTFAYLFPIPGSINPTTIRVDSQGGIQGERFSQYRLVPVRFTR